LASRRDNPAVVDAFSGEQKLFEARLHSRNGQRSQLRQRIVQINEEIAGLSAQITGKESELKYIDQELIGVITAGHPAGGRIWPNSHYVPDGVGYFRMAGGPGDG
jgi:hypothetical protein